MILENQTLKSRQQTANEIYALAKDYKDDLFEFKNWELKDFYNMVRDIPYLEDIPGIEVTSRPMYLLDPEYFTMLDCKKKVILMASFFELQNMPYLLVATSDSPENAPHHIFLIAWDGEDWLPVDSTLPTDILFEDKPNYNHEVFF